MPQPRRIFISVAEASADLHAAALVRHAREAYPEWAFYGLTGPRLRELGVETVADLTSHAAMLTGAVRIARRAWNILNDCERRWRETRPDVVVLLDSPELHLGVPELGLHGFAGRAKKLDIPVVYYVAPQTWASRPWRERAIGRDVDRLACILPFEEAYFRQRGIRADFVGHPLFESLRREPRDERFVARVRSPRRPIVTLLPGSRRGVVDAVLPLQLDVVRRLRSRLVDVDCLISCADDERRAQIQAVLNRYELEAELHIGRNADLLNAADLVLVASGTATLEVAFHRKPMIVMYQAGGSLRIPYELLGRRFLRTPHLSLVNILGDARVVPEFMPFVPDAATVARVAAQILADETWRACMIRQLDALVTPLERTSASETVCAMVSQAMKS
ncbi:MAG: hypothetical protein JNG88_03065 [Phycisphaerales bacterium]|nr:hypothetical protein [Phycisphaerales bacterium]